MLARRFWPLVVAILLLFAVVTLFPLGLRISWPFLGLTALYATTLILVVDALPRVRVSGRGHAAASRAPIAPRA